MNQTFQNSAQVLSIGIFFTLMILGLASSLPHTLTSGLKAHGVSAATAGSVAHLPPVSVLFAAFLGYNPIETPRRRRTRSRSLSAANHARSTGRSFFPQLISAPFQHGPARGVRVRDPRLPDRRGRVADARRQVSLRRAGCRATGSPGRGQAPTVPAPRATARADGASTITQITTREEQHAS